MMLRKATTISLALFSVAACSSTSNVNGLNARIDHVVITKPTPNFAGPAPGSSALLIARAYDARDAELIESVRFQWASSDTAIMVVDQSGNVSSKCSGNATIRVDASRNDLSRSASVALFSVAPV